MFPSTIQSMDFSNSEQTILSIRITTDGFYFSIYNPIQGNFQVTQIQIDRKRSIVSNFKNIVATNPFLSQLYKKVNIIVANTRTILHPLHLFEESKIKDLYYISQKLINTTNDVLSNQLENNNLAVIFSINNVLHKYLTEHFSGGVNIYAQNTPLLNHFNKEALNSPSNKLFIYFEEECMQVFAYNRDKLILNNNYLSKEINNQLYYILYTWKQLNFSQEKDDLYLLGYLDQKEELIEVIKKYISSIHPILDTEYLDLKSISL